MRSADAESYRYVYYAGIFVNSRRLAQKELICPDLVTSINYFAIFRNIGTFS